MTEGTMTEGTTIGNTMMMQSTLDSTSIEAFIHTEVEKACNRIAPVWPLDQSIAVNPWWTMRSTPMTHVAARLQALGKTHCLMPADYYLSLWQTTVHSQHLRAACEELAIQADDQVLVDFLKHDKEPQGHWHNMTDLLDTRPEQQKKMAWHDEVIQQISQFCGAYFQYPERLQREARHKDPHYKTSPEDDLYRAWCEVTRQDKGVALLMGEATLNTHLNNLPGSPADVFLNMFNLLGQPQSFSDYAHALLLEINGWASWLAYTAWQDTFDNKPNNQVMQLLAIRMAWEWVLWQHVSTRDPITAIRVKQQLIAQFGQSDYVLNQHAHYQRYLWVWQRASEYAFQQPLHHQLVPASLPASDSVPEISVPEINVPEINVPEIQAAFCIDIRSEPMRRALESQSKSIQTIGFAGFFGLPIEYAPTSSGYTRPQLPGLIKPALQATQSGVDATENTNTDTSFDNASLAAPAAFGIVEASGLAKIMNLLKRSYLALQSHHSTAATNASDCDGQWQLSQQGEPVSIESQAELAAGILQAMGLTDIFAPQVLLVGHGSCSANNPQAASLDCGACGGQSGEVNVKVLAQLLNDQAVRDALRGHDITIPPETLFIAALHNTTTDEIHCFGIKEKAKWHDWLLKATDEAQQSRAASLNLDDQTHLNRRYQHRSQDWAEVRPEWGLANNAAFIIAPRQQTRHLDLQGRCFLHDYSWQNDPAFEVLELILTAPMVVTHWINLQYYASVTDNGKYGSGNKLLHNVVAEHLGVFEGNSGDLRAGLSLQSLHDGRNWRHEPLRLSVYVAAPRETISTLIERHETIKNLVHNDWLFLFQLDNKSRSIWQYRKSKWLPVTKEETNAKYSVTASS